MTIYRKQRSTAPRGRSVYGSYTPSWVAQPEPQPEPEAAEAPAAVGEAPAEDPAAFGFDTFAAGYDAEEPAGYDASSAYAYGAEDAGDALAAPAAGDAAAPASAFDAASAVPEPERIGAFGPLDSAAPTYDAYAWPAPDDGVAAAWESAAAAPYGEQAVAAYDAPGEIQAVSEPAPEYVADDEADADVAPVADEVDVAEEPAVELVDATVENLAFDVSLAQGAADDLAAAEAPAEPALAPTETVALEGDAAPEAVAAEGDALGKEPAAEDALAADGEAGPSDGGPAEKAEAPAAEADGRPEKPAEPAAEDGTHVDDAAAPAAPAEVASGADEPAEAESAAPTSDLIAPAPVDPSIAPAPAEPAGAGASASEEGPAGTTVTLALDLGDEPAPAAAPAEDKPAARPKRKRARRASRTARAEEPAPNRTATVHRATGETDITVELDLDGSGTAHIATGVPFFDHMLDAFTRHGLFDLTVDATGDVEVDAHHTVEDTGIVLGQAFAEALGEKRGVTRFADVAVPLDEALVQAVVDLSGRGQAYCQLPMPTERVGAFDTELAVEFFYAFARDARATLHVRELAGANSHHIIEAAFKAAGRAMRRACELDPRVTGVPSTKGSL